MNQASKTTNSKPEGVRITAQELTTLMLESTPSNFLSLKYGVGWVMLLTASGNRWALKRVAEMREIELRKKSEQQVKS